MNVCVGVFVLMCVMGMCVCIRECMCAWDCMCMCMFNQTLFNSFLCIQSWMVSWPKLFICVYLESTSVISCIELYCPIDSRGVLY